MAPRVVHTKVSAVPDGPDTSVIRPTDWNADHALTGVQGTLTLTTTGTSGAATLVADTLNIPNYTFADTGITQLTGDVTAGPGNGSQVATLANVVSASTQTKITYNAKGLVTAGAQAAASDLSNGTTGTGAIVLANSPTLVTPNLGVPSAIDLTNATNAPRPTPRVVATASTATLTPNANTTDISAVTAQAVNLTIAAPTGTPVDGQQLTIRIRDNGTTRTLTWNATYVELSTGELPVTTVINKTHYLVFWWNSATSAWELVGGNPVSGLWQ